MKTSLAPLAAVVGNPVKHSLSPEIFGAISRMTGVSLTYGKMELEPGDFKKAFKLAENGSFLGWNVTIPFKEAAFRSCRRLSREARQIGAVNVVRFGSRGAEGFNTDVLGISEAFREHRVKLRGSTAQVYGAGGAARAAIYALGSARAKEIWIWNRTHARAARLAREFSRIFRRTDIYAGLAPKPCAIHVQTTSAGMKGNPGRIPLAKCAIGLSRSVAFEMVYRPRDTAFLRQARRQRMTRIEGLDMLVWQAIGTWEIWNGAVRGQSRAKLKMQLKKHLIEVLK